MLRVLTILKDRALKIYAVIKAMDEIPLRVFNEEFYEEKPVKVQVPRKNNVTIEDLRPKK